MSRPRRWLRRAAWCLGVLALVGVGLWGTLSLLMRQWVAKPPALAERSALREMKTEMRQGRFYLGRNWFERREGLGVLYLTGSAYDMGYANGFLTQELLRRQEDALLQMLQRVAPFRWTQFLLKFVVVYKNRHLPRHIAPAYQQEILGLTHGCPDPHPEVGPFYHRILNYHAAQDVSYMLMNSPLLRGGCTALAAWGAQTDAGRLLCARNFDWEADPVFDRDRVVVLCEPQEGIPFVSLAWAGMAGCVSGMNREGLSITVNGAPSDLPAGAATPTCLVAREVLQFARTLEEAAAIIRQRQVFVSALFLVGSRRDGRFVVVEKTPRSCAVREAQGAQHLICANHYQTPELEAEPINQAYKRADTSVSRYDRLKELLGQSSLPLDEARSVALLRDRRLPGGRFAGNGHRGSLNPLIATHAVVMDLSGGVFWAGTSPHQLGRFMAFDLSALERAAPGGFIPADPMLAAGEYARFLEARASLEAARQALAKGHHQHALACARVAETNNPGFYQNAWLEAEAQWGLGRVTEAGHSCRTALERQPAVASERRQIEQLAARIAGRSPDHPPAATPRAENP
jgi:isopenicillin-N N-acyltransferase like protein